MDETTIANTLHGAHGLGRPIIREFIIDFLGALVPGLIFSVAIVGALAVPAWKVFGFFMPSMAGDVAYSFTNKIDPAATILLLVLPMFLLLLASAYVCGHLFFRQDPKKADIASFKAIERNDDGTGMTRTIECKGRATVTRVEFPYHFLKNYLLDRGILYLARIVPWGPVDHLSFEGDDRERAKQRLKALCGRRAKHFANALKLRIQMSSPSAFATLARNEAHVRLSSSLWYVTWALFYSAPVGIAICLLPAVIATDPVSLTWHPENIESLVIVPAIVLFSAFVVNRAIVRALHYQREREVLFILETAYWLQLTGVAPKIFEGLTEAGAQERSC